VITLELCSFFKVHCRSPSISNSLALTVCKATQSYTHFVFLHIWRSTFRAGGLFSPSPLKLGSLVALVAVEVHDRRDFRSLCSFHFPIPKIRPILRPSASSFKSPPFWGLRSCHVRSLHSLPGRGKTVSSGRR